MTRLSQIKDYVKLSILIAATHYSYHAMYVTILYFHFIDEETEAWRDKKIVLSHSSKPPKVSGPKNHAFHLYFLVIMLIFLIENTGVMTSFNVFL